MTLVHACTGAVAGRALWKLRRTTKASSTPRFEKNEPVAKRSRPPSGVLASSAMSHQRVMTASQSTVLVGAAHSGSS